MKSTKKLFSRIGIGTLGLLAGVGVFMSIASPSMFTSTPQETVADDTFYKVSYDKDASTNGKLSVLLSGELKNYKGFTEQKLKDFLSVVKSSLNQAIVDDLGKSLFDNGIATTLDLADFTPLKSGFVAEAIPAPYSSLDVAFIEQLVLSNMAGGTLLTTPSSIITFKLDGTHSNEQMVKYLADRYATAYAASPNNPDDKAAAISKIATKVATTAQDKATQVFTDAEITEPAPLTYDVVSGWITSLSATEPYLVDMKDMTNIFQAIQNDMALHFNDQYMADIVNQIGGDVVKAEITVLLNTSTAEELVDFLKKTDSTCVAQTLKAVQYTKDDLMPNLDKIGIDKLVDVANEIQVDGLKDIFSSVEGLTKNDIQTFLKDNSAKLSWKKLFSTVNFATIDDEVVYANKKIVMSGVKAFIRSLPRPSTIANWTDDQMKLTRTIEVNTSLGDVNIDITFGFFGNCDLVRKVFKAIADTVDVKKVGGRYYVQINVPNLVGKLVKYVDDEDLVDDSMKHRIFDFLFSTFEEQYNTIITKTWASVISDLKSLDYEKIVNTLISAENLNKLFGTNKFTDERVDKIINMFVRVIYLSAKYGAKGAQKVVRDFLKMEGYEQSKIKKIVDKVLELAERFKAKGIDAELLRKMLAEGTLNDKLNSYIDKYLTDKENYWVKACNALTRLYNIVPDKYKQKSIMDAYKGDGVFQADIKATLDYKKILNAITPKYGDKLFSAISGYIDELPSQIDFNLKAVVKNMRAVTYEIDGVTKRGFLTQGMDVPFYANCTSIIIDTKSYDVVKWVKLNESGLPAGEVTEMPLEDIKVVPVTDFDITSSANVNTIFDNNNHEISVTVEPANSAYKYQWQKYNADTQDWDDIAGATSSKHNVKLVSDSGDYRCKVEYPGFLTKYSTDDGKDPINVIITNAEIDLSTVEWNFDPENPFVYNGNEQSVSLVDTTLPSGNNVYYTYALSGDVTKTDAGDYTATATFTIKPEYAGQLKFTGGEGTDKNVLTLNWSIAKKVVKASDFTFTWVDADGNPVTGLTYTGSTQTVKIDENLLPSYIAVDSTSYVDNQKKDAGTYTASVTIVSNSSNYAVDPTDNTASIQYTIDPYTLDFSATALQTDSFVYDGSEKTVALDSTTLPTALGTDTNVYSTSFSTVAGYDSKATNAGSYVAGVDVTINNSNYTTVNGSSLTIQLSWTIEQAEITQADVDAITWKGGAGSTYPTDGFIYDGNAKSVVVDSYDTNKFVLGSYTDSVKQNAGSYTAKVALTATSNYKFASGVSNESTFAWKINPKTLVASDFANIKWQDTLGEEPDYVYNGDDHTMEVVNLPTGVSSTVAYSGDRTAANAGSYTVTATFSPANGNYAIDAAAKTASKTWKIAKAELNFSSVKWSTTTTFTYNGAEQGLTLTGNKPAGEGTIYTIELTDATKVNAGSYTAKMAVKLSSDASGNYAVKGTPANKSWKINKASINFSSLKWSSTTSYVYNGQEQSIALTGNKPAGEGTLYTITVDNTAVDVGEYTAKVTIVILPDAKQNYQYTNKPSNVTWKITPYTYQQSDFDGVVWTNTTVVYDTTEHTVLIDESTLPSYVKVSDNGYKNNKKTYAGDYVASAKVEVTNTNYAIADDVKVTCNWTIEQAEVLKSSFYGIIFVGTDGKEYSTFSSPSFVYNSAKQGLTVKESSYASIAGVKLGYVSGGSATIVGNYTIVARFDLIDTNYRFENGFDGKVSLDWSITQRNVTIDDVVFVDATGKVVEEGATYPYSGTMITLFVDETTIEKGVKLVNVTGNSAMKAGDYTAVATFKAQDSNYCLVGEDTLTINWSISKISIDISSVAWDYVDSNPFIYDGKEKTVALKNLPAGEGTLYSVSYNGNKATEIGNYTASSLILLKDANNYELVGAQPKTLSWRIISGSKKITDISSEEKDSSGNLLVKIKYAPGIDEKYKLHSTKLDETTLGLEKLDWTPVFKDVGGYVYVVYDINFKDGETVVPMSLTDGTSFETYILIPEDIRSNTNLKIVNIADDGKITEFEAQKEGNYMKFNTTHFSRYAIVEIKGTAVPWWVFVIIALCVIIIALQIVIILKKFKKGGEPEEAKEAPVETPKEELKKEEPVELKPLDETPVEKAADEGPVEVEEQRPEEPESNYIVDEAGTKQLLVRSFSAKLCQTTDEVKAFYNDFKNNIMAYRLNGKEKVRSVISWKYEAFYCGREIVCKLKIKRRNLMIYSPLNPKTFEGTPVKVEDVGGAKATADTPTMMVITSDRKVRYANRMVEAVLAPLGLELDKEVARVDFTKGYRYASNKTLLAKGLIKTAEAPADLFKN